MKQPMMYAHTLPTLQKNMDHLAQLDQPSIHAGLRVPSNKNCLDQLPLAWITPGL